MRRPIGERPCNGRAACGITGCVATEGDFAVWLDRRDAEALARVFDATGGKLLLLAAHLAGDGAQPQDLVQATFVAAMARGATWDRGRQLWPWLAAILHNEARMQARGARRRREVALHDQPEAAPDDGDPQRLVASQEVLAAVLAAIDALPLPYRQVLRLRLVHGLRPVDIARSLEVPVGTVRAQLHRGLEQLRTALPAGVAGVLAALLIGDDALLAQVRERVLEHATSAAPATAAVAAWSLLGGWWAMKGKVIGVVVAAGLLLAGLSFAFGVPAWFAEPPLPAQSPALARAELPAANANPTPSPAAGRELVADAAAAVWPLEVTVREPGDAPIAGANVEVWTAPTCSMITDREHGAFGRQDVTAGETGADGVFRARLDALRDRSALFRRTNLLWLRARWPHSQPRDWPLSLPRGVEGQTFAATIELARRHVLAGTVVDGSGRAVAGAKVMAIAATTDLRHDEHYRVFAGADGVFVMDVHNPDHWPEQLAVLEPGTGIAIVQIPPRPAEASRTDLGTIVLRGNETVHGRVVLGDDLPLAHFPVAINAIDPQLAGDPVKALDQLWQPGESPARLVRREDRLVWHHADALTRADGSFTFTGLDPGTVYVVHVGMYRGFPVATATVRPGEEPVQLRADAQLLLIEARGEGGELLPGTGLTNEGWDPSTTWRSPQPRPGFPETGWRVGNAPFAADPDGRLALLSPFGWVWRVSTNNDDTVPASLRHDVLPGVHRATRVLDLRTETRFGKLHVVAVDENDAPLANWGVTLRAVDRDLSINDGRMTAKPEGRTWELPAGAWDLHVLLGKEALFAPQIDSYVRGFHDQRVAIEPGRTTEVKVAAKPAGQVAFRLEWPAAMPRKFVRFESAGREIQMTPVDRDSRAFRERPYDGWPVLWVTRQALPPGPHTFVVMVEGFEPAIVHVDVVADRLVDARAEIRPL